MFPNENGEQEVAVVSPAPEMWNGYSTTGFGLAIFMVFFAVQIGAVVLSGFGLDWFDPGIDYGMARAVGAAAGGVLCTPLIPLVLVLRGTPDVREFLGLRAVSAKEMLGWTGLSIILVYAGDFVTSYSGRPTVPDVIVHAYETAIVVPLFWFAVVVAAPLFEEVFFRGFLFEGFRRSRLGSVGAAAVTTTAWTVIHLQYDAFELSLVFALGIFLSIARIVSRSLYVPFFLHAIMNLIATIQTMLAATGGDGSV